VFIRTVGGPWDELVHFIKADNGSGQAAVRQVRRAALGGSEKSYRRTIAELELLGKDRPSVKSFYVNDRVVMLDESAEIQRVSRMPWTGRKFFWPAASLCPGRLRPVPGGFRIQRC